MTVFMGGLSLRARASPAGTSSALVDVPTIPRPRPQHIIREG
ncbi:hypothetical protein [Gordonia sp. NB41Y]|nr:hypothetical protein [Gordonia sp. NB41Y]WLP92624.1 hypothetical protein Q9K23_10540 [Gordonia sp. NB41Y]